MTASEKLMQKLVHLATGVRHETPEAIREAFSEAEEGDDLQDVMSGFRSGKESTGLPAEYSRHYESRAVAAQMLDGSWVGWTYWYGGGKHGEPGAIPWVEDAYDVTMTEVTKVVREFSRPT